MLLLEKFIICPGEESDIFRWYKLYLFMDMQIIISLHMMLLFGKKKFEQRA
jgi:hypothetical protein